MHPKEPKNNRWADPAIILTLVAMMIAAVNAYTVFNNNTDRRLSVLESQVKPLWDDWVAQRAHR